MTVKFLEILALSDSVYGDEPGCPKIGWTTAELTGQADNQVVRLEWPSEGEKTCVTYLTEDGVNSAEFDEATTQFTLEDFEGTPVRLKLVSKERVLTPADGTRYVLIQEGGSSAELYVHAHASLADAEADRVSCEEGGSYRTSEIVEVPASLAAHPQFYEVVEQLVRATGTLSYPSEV